MLLLVYTATIFLSASLLFLVQPMVAKMLLPLLGGSPAVWNTSMVFFQAVLLAGYLYAHLLTRRLAPARQVLVHACVLIVPLLVITALGRLPVLDPRTFTPPGSDYPALWLLGALALAVGAPFFVLSTTGPLMQRWFAATTHKQAKDPYFLYAASNIGSMLALLGYPLLMERTLKIGEQRVWFAAGFFAFVAMAIGCGIMMLRSRPSEPATRHERRHPKTRPGHEAPTGPEAPPPPIPMLTRLRWIALAAVPSSLMLGVTQHVSSDIASFPLMWVIPLALYLLTFILAFSSRGVPVPKLSLLYFGVAGFLAMALLARMGSPVWALISAHMLGLFLGALVCHGRLAQERPDARRLTEFYLLIALGGVLGGSFNALLAPVIFNDIAEYPIAIAAACLLAAPSFGDRRPGRPAEGLPLDTWVREIAPFALMALAWSVIFVWTTRDPDVESMGFRVIFSVITAGLAAACVWRARRRPLGLDLFESALYLLTGITWSLILAWATSGTVFGRADYWIIFGTTTLGLGAYCCWRAKVRPAVFDALAPVAALLYVAGIAYAFRHAGWAGGWYTGALGGVAAILLALRLALPRRSEVSIVCDLGVPALVALSYLMANPAIRQAQAPTAEGQLDLGPVRYLIVCGPPAFLMLLAISRRLRFALSVAAIMALFYNYAGAVDPRLLTTRTFFGVHRVSQDALGRWRLLSHGTTRHGIQATDPDRAMIPTMYYHPSGPIGQIFKSRENDPTFDRVAIVGLGTGGLAAYGREGVTIDFYEIDPEVVWIAKDSGLFTYLKRTKAKFELILGDGRLMLSKAPPGTYDLIILDAFSSDSIPMHLITRQAAEMYFTKLAEGGMLVFHVSNRYLEARPVVGAIGNDMGVPTMTREDNEISDQEAAEGKLSTTWVALARRIQDFGDLANDPRWQLMRVTPDAPRWTDDYSNILPVLNYK